MSKRNLFFLFSFLLLILVAGCAPICTAEEMASFTPILEYPTNGAEVSYDSQITFNWTHNESCRPLEYEIGIGPLGHYFVDGESSDFTFDLGLSPGTQYEWSVRGIVEGENNFTGRSPWADSWAFVTDGMCSSVSELEPPELTKPQYGEWLGEGQGPGPGQVRIQWTYSGNCHPDFFQYELASDPEFTNIITSGITEKGKYNAYIQVPRCARVYWRVRARIGNEKGPFSDTSRFTYASISSCFQNQQSIDASLIKGYVFEDYCAATTPWVPEGVGIAPPCVFGEPYGVHADGVRARRPKENEMTGEIDPAEIGIPGVVVDLGAGPCPSTGLDQFTTLENGNYYFMVQSPGNYCVSVDKTNNPSLDHGIWTLPLTDQRITEATITFNPGDDLKFQNFGWDQNDFLRIEFFVDLLSVCRFGPSPDYHEVAFVNAGEAIPIFGRNEDATWFATSVDGMRCFISIASGEPAEGANGLPIFPKQPEPVIPESKPSDDTSKVNCSKYYSEQECHNAGCEWTRPGLIPSKCVPK